MSSENTHVLTYEEVRRLDELLGSPIQVHGRGNFPTLEIKPREFVAQVLERLTSEKVNVHDVRLNGSTASFVLNDGQGDAESDSVDQCTDLDLIFNVDLPSISHFQLVKNCVLDTLIDFLPSEASKDRMTNCIMKEAYVRKMVKVANKPDTWSLISLANNQGRNMELKFVDTMKRKFEFSIDSFQIHLNSLLGFHGISSKEMSSTFYPSIEAVSEFGNFEEARYHLRNKLIGTRKPEEIRGGGLLKYCNLLLKDYTPVSDAITNMEKYMCSRFFIDFSDIPSQKRTLESYLDSHSLSSTEKRYNYLMILYRVVESSTVCLMSHERRITLRMILDMANEVFVQQAPTSCSSYQQQRYIYYQVPQYLPSRGRMYMESLNRGPIMQLADDYYIPPQRVSTREEKATSTLVPCH